MKGFLIFCLAMPLLLGFVACTGENEETASSAKQSAKDSAFELPEDYFD